MNCANCSRVYARCKNLCCDSCVADIRLAGSFSSMAPKKFWKSSLHAKGSWKNGAQSVTIFSITFMPSLISAKGGTPSAISSTVMPSDQISTESLYGMRRISSGAIQCGVPTSEFRLDCSLVSTAAPPKSTNFTWPSVSSMMFTLLMSRWIWWWRCMYFSASKTSFVT